MTGTTTEETSREDIPLKTGAKSSKWYSCDEEFLSGTKFINIAFGTLTFIITIALLVQIYYGDYQVVPHGSVATDSLDCSKIGTRVLKKGGNAIDAAIASTFCLTVVAPHVTGLDGEGQILIYNHRTRLMPNIIDFSSNILTKEKPRLLVGLAYIHQQYGSTPWKELVQSSAELAKEFEVSKNLAQAVTQAKVEHLYGKLEWKQVLQLETLSETLEAIGNITEKDLYSFIDPSNLPVQSQATKSTFQNYDFFVPNLDNVGQILSTNLRDIEEYNFTEPTIDTTKQIIESTLSTYETFNVSNKYHEGTFTNVAVMDLDENYVSLTSGMYALFGSKNMTSHGYVLDVEARDKPCIRIPIILTDHSYICGKRMATGANGIAQASQLITNLVIGARNISGGIEAPRFYIVENSSIAVEVDHYPKFDLKILQFLNGKHLNTVRKTEPYYSSNIVSKVKDDLRAHSDRRGGGIASRFR